MSDIADFLLEIFEGGASSMSDIADWTVDVNGAGGGTFPTFTGAGNPEGVQVGNYGDTYEDTETGILFAKTSSDDDGTPNNWGFDLEGIIAFGYAGTNNYPNPPTFYANTTLTQMFGFDYVVICSGNNSLPQPSPYGVMIQDQGTPGLGGGGVTLNTQQGGIALTCGTLHNTAPQTILIESTGTTYLGTGIDAVIIGNTTNTLGFFGSTGATKPARISPPSGGSTVDTQARTVITSILSLLESLGLMT